MFVQVPAEHVGTDWIPPRVVEVEWRDGEWVHYSDVAPVLEAARRVCQPGSDAAGRQQAAREAVAELR